MAGCESISRFRTRPRCWWQSDRLCFVLLPLERCGHSLPNNMAGLTIPMVFTRAPVYDPFPTRAQENLFGARSMAKHQALPANESTRSFLSEPSSNLKVRWRARSLEIEKESC